MYKFILLCFFLFVLITVAIKIMIKLQNKNKKIIGINNINRSKFKYR